MKKELYIGIGMMILAVVIFAIPLSKYNKKYPPSQPPTNQELLVATFAGGCFWCSESDMEKTRGVIDAVSGFAGGTSDNPQYQEVASGNTDYREAVQVYYDPTMVTYDQLLDVYWRHIDPTDDGGQFADRGFQYSTAIFYHDERQKQLAERSKYELEHSEIFNAPIVTSIIPFTNFFPAEEYHQDYYKKNPEHYNRYRNGSGRNPFIIETWSDGLKKAQEHIDDGNKAAMRQNAQEVCTSFGCFTRPSLETLQAQLTPLQYNVTQQEGTEAPFDNTYWDNEAEGIYVDIISGEPLFSSTHKFKSGTGWPSFTQAIDEEFITKHTDYKLFYPRTEVRSKMADSHLGHIFNDAPAELGGVRWCINSAALRFIPKEDMTQNYSDYLYLFE